MSVRLGLGGVSQLTQLYRTLRIASCLPTASFANPLFSTPAIAIPAVTRTLDILSDIWEGVLKAVPKKKTSHMKRRHRQLAGKALKDVTSLNTCPSCGELKRAHYLCQNCVEAIRSDWNKAGKGLAETK